MNFFLLVFRPDKKLLAIVLSTLVVILSLPILVVYTVSQSGLAVASSVLAFINPVTHLIEVHDADGRLITTMTATTTWPAKGGVTTEFGDPTPYQVHHTGIDIADVKNSPITVFMEGKVIAVQDNENNPTGFGKYVLVDHGNGIRSYYAHLNSTNATFGQDVKPGDIIGNEGATGHVTGIHLHFEIQVSGVPVNPRTFVTGEPSR